MLHRPVSRQRRHRRRPMLADTPTSRLCRLIETEVAATFAVPLKELRAPTRRSPMTAFARQSAIYLAHVAYGLSYSTVAQAFARDRTTAAHACRLVEERREDPAIDQVLYALECACAALTAAGARPHGTRS